MARLCIFTRRHESTKARRIVYCALLVLLNLLADMIYPWLDRRIKLS